MQRINLSNLSAVNTLSKSEMQNTVGGLKLFCFRIPFTHKRVCVSVSIGLGLNKAAR